MAYEHTFVAPEKSQGAIKKLLMSHGGSNIAFVSATEPQRVEGFRATVTLGDQAYGIKIAVPVAEKLNEKKQDQEVRYVWRVLYHHLKSIFVAADSGVIDIRELLLPYFVTKGGQTVAERILGEGDLQKALDAPKGKVYFNNE